MTDSDFTLWDDEFNDRFKPGQSSFELLDDLDAKGIDSPRHLTCHVFCGEGEHGREYRHQDTYGRENTQPINAYGMHV